VDIPRIFNFKLGQVVITPGALEALRESGESPWVFLIRHVACDWGDLDQHDKDRNEQALKDGSRLFSAYRTAKGEKVWVITEAEPRSSTCILTPDEY
jgi:hypothetical protein